MGSAISYLTRLTVYVLKSTEYTNADMLKTFSLPATQNGSMVSFAQTEGD